ncbi:MAG: hypothetical protein ACOZQL_04645 [Myxococcota bacterium]
MFLVDAVVSEPGALRSVVFRIGTTDVPGTQGVGGHWTASLPTEVVERSETITVIATDAAGNVGTATRPVKVDRVAPTITVASPGPGVFRTAIALSVQTSDAAAVSAELEGTMVTLTGGPTQWSGSMSVATHDYRDVPLSVRAVDAAGNERLASVTIGVDTVAPTILFTAPTPGQKFKISDFATSTNVTTSWTISDGDAQAATTSVNGSPSASTSFSRPTSPTDNPASYTTTVVAADRAGNTTTQSISYSVDRVAPTMTSSGPSNGQRNLSTRAAFAVFSEPVLGAAAGIVSGGATYAGFWDGARVRYDISDNTLAGKAVEFSVNPSLTDLHGNPVVVGTSWRAHFATWFAPNSTVTLGTGIGAFDVSTDSDGVATIAYQTVGANNFKDIGLIADTGGVFAQTVVDTGAGLANIAAPVVNSWNVVNQTSLASLSRVGLSYSSATAGSPARAPGQTVYVARMADGSAVTFQTFTTRAAVVSRPAFAFETGTAAFGLVNSGAFTRNPAPAILMPSTAAYGRVIQSNENWSAVASSGSEISIARFFCKGTCNAVAYSAPTSSAALAVQGASTRSGSCFALTWDSSATRYGYFLARPTCEYLVTSNCAATTTLSSAALPLTDLRVGTWDANGEDTLLFSYRSGSDLVLAKMNAGACSTASAIIAQWTLAGAKAHAPVRIGNKAALLYIDASDVLKLQLAP